jgi:hypothetical protein
MFKKIKKTGLAIFILMIIAMTGATSESFAQGINKKVPPNNKQGMTPKDGTIIAKPSKDVTIDLDSKQPFKFNWTTTDKGPFTIKLFTDGNGQSVEDLNKSGKPLYQKEAVTGSALDIPFDNFVNLKTGVKIIGIVTNNKGEIIYCAASINTTRSNIKNKSTVR